MEDESSAVTSPPSPKRTKITGAATYGTKFKLERMGEFPFIAEGHKDPFSARYVRSR